MNASTPAVSYHYAAMRRAESAANSISVRLSVRGFLGSEPAEEIARLKAVRDSYYRLAAAHRNAARRLERGERMRARLERVVRLVTRGSLRAARAAVTR